MHPIWTMLDPRMGADMLGLIPAMLDDSDPRPAREQFAENYAHGGGWAPMAGWNAKRAQASGRIFIWYPGDDPLPALAQTKLRDETITFHDGAWVCITQPNGDFEISRMD